MFQWFRSPLGVAIVFESALGLVALALYSLLGGTLGPWPGGAPLAVHARAVAAGIAATLPLLALLYLLERYPIGPFRELHELGDRLLVPLFAEATLAQMALVALAAGGGEELLFRGWLQSSLAAWWPGPWGTAGALATASVLFGVCHWLTRTYAVLAALVGVYLGALLLATDHLLAPMTAHALYDFLALVYLVRFSSHRRPPTPREGHDELLLDEHLP